MPELREGLKSLPEQLPEVPGGFVRLGMGIEEGESPFARLEAGWRPTAQWGLYGFGVLAQEEKMAGAGVEFRW